MMPRTDYEQSSDVNARFARKGIVFIVLICVDDPTKAT